MITIGSRAMQFYNILPESRKVNDWDFICTFSEFRKWTRNNKSSIKSCNPVSDSSYHVRFLDGMNYEFEIAWAGTTGGDLLDSFKDEYLTPSWQLAMKLSHRYLKNSTHFLKTMRDIQHLRNICKLNEVQQKWLNKREIETYTYQHPKLDVDKEAFFKDDGIRYVYDHDSIHETQALLWSDNGDTEWPRPAYTFYMKDDSEVMTCKEKFFGTEERIRLYGVYEEACVLALERSQIPYDFKPDPRKSFEKALMKVCTSITSGWFREYAWKNYDEVISLYEKWGETDYVDSFHKHKHLLKSFSKS